MDETLYGSVCRLRDRLAALKVPTQYEPADELSFYDDVHDARAFGEQLAANPRDETIRGAFADWLRDRGRDDEAFHVTSAPTHVTVSPEGTVSVHPTALTDRMEGGFGRGGFNLNDWLNDDWNMQYVNAFNRLRARREAEGAASRNTHQRFGHNPKTGAHSPWGAIEPVPIAGNLPPFTPPPPRQRGPEHDPANYGLWDEGGPWDRAFEVDPARWDAPPPPPDPHPDRWGFGWGGQATDDVISDRDNARQLTRWRTQENHLQDLDHPANSSPARPLAGSDWLREFTPPPLTKYAAEETPAPNDPAWDRRRHRPMGNTVNTRTVLGVPVSRSVRPSARQIDPGIVAGGLGSRGWTASREGYGEGRGYPPEVVQTPRVRANIVRPHPDYPYTPSPHTQPIRPGDESWWDWRAGLGEFTGPAGWGAQDYDPPPPDADPENIHYQDGGALPVKYELADETEIAPFARQLEHSFNNIKGNALDQSYYTAHADNAAVFADYLADRGDPREHLIRGTVESYRNPYIPHLFTVAKQHGADSSTGQTGGGFRSNLLGPEPVRLGTLPDKSQIQIQGHKFRRLPHPFVELSWTAHPETDGAAYTINATNYFHPDEAAELINRFNDPEMSHNFQTYMEMMKNTRRGVWYATDEVPTQYAFPRGRDSTTHQFLRSFARDPYDDTAHAAFADHLQGVDESSPLPHLIRQFAQGYGASNNWHEWAANQQDPDAADLMDYPDSYPMGDHGPFRLFLSQEGIPEHHQIVSHVLTAVPNASHRAPFRYHFELRGDEARQLADSFGGDVGNSIHATLDRMAPAHPRDEESGLPPLTFPPGPDEPTAYRYPKDDFGNATGMMSPISWEQFLAGRWGPRPNRKNKGPVGHYSADTPTMYGQLAPNLHMFVPEENAAWNAVQNASLSERHSLFRQADVHGILADHLDDHDDPRSRLVRSGLSFHMAVDELERNRGLRLNQPRSVNLPDGTSLYVYHYTDENQQSRQPPTKGLQVSWIIPRMRNYYHDIMSPEEYADWADQFPDDARDEVRNAGSLGGTTEYATTDTPVCYALADVRPFVPELQRDCDIQRASQTGDTRLVLADHLADVGDPREEHLRSGLSWINVDNSLFDQGYRDLYTHNNDDYHAVVRQHPYLFGPGEFLPRLKEHKFSDGTELLTRLWRHPKTGEYRLHTMWSIPGVVDYFHSVHTPEEFRNWIERFPDEDREALKQTYPFPEQDINPEAPTEYSATEYATPWGRPWLMPHTSRLADLIQVAPSEAGDPAYHSALHDELLETGVTPDDARRMAEHVTKEGINRNWGVTVGRDGAKMARVNRSFNVPVYTTKIYQALDRLRARVGENPAVWKLYHAIGGHSTSGMGITDPMRERAQELAKANYLPVYPHLAHNAPADVTPQQFSREPVGYADEDQYEPPGGDDWTRPPMRSEQPPEPSEPHSDYFPHLQPDPDDPARIALGHSAPAALRFSTNLMGVHSTGQLTRQGVRVPNYERENVWRALAALGHVQAADRAWRNGNFNQARMEHSMAMSYHNELVEHGDYPGARRPRYDPDADPFDQEEEWHPDHRNLEAQAYEWHNNARIANQLAALHVPEGGPKAVLSALAQEHLRTGDVTPILAGADLLDENGVPGAERLRELAEYRNHERAISFMISQLRYAWPYEKDQSHE